MEKWNNSLEILADSTLGIDVTDNGAFRSLRVHELKERDETGHEIRHCIVAPSYGTGLTCFEDDHSSVQYIATPLSEIPGAYVYLIHGIKFTICKDADGLQSPSCILPYGDFMARKQQINLTKAILRGSKPEPVPKRIGLIRR